MAERGGFEPPLRLLTVNRFSKPAPSATRPPLHRRKAQRKPRPPPPGQGPGGRTQFPVPRTQTRKSCQGPVASFQNRTGAPGASALGSGNWVLETSFRQLGTLNRTGTLTRDTRAGIKRDDVRGPCRVPRSRRIHRRGNLSRLNTLSQEPTAARAVGFLLATTSAATSKEDRNHEHCHCQRHP